MAITAPLSRHKKTNYVIAFVVLVALSAWFGYDGYLNKGFAEKHTDKDGKPNGTLVFNRQAPFYLLPAAAVVVVAFLLAKDKKAVADETGLHVGKTTVAYDSIEKIDKTYFESKGFFVVTYKNAQGAEASLRLSDRTYDGLPAVLEELIRRIS